MATLADVRSLFEARVKESGKEPTELFHPLDLERVKDEKYLKRIFDHSDKDAKAAADMLWNILTWRQTVGASDINETNIRMDYVNVGMFFPHGRDIDGSLLLILRSKLHSKGQKDYDELKKIMIYWFDRIEREENGKPITMFFDMDGAGLSNFDLELIKYLIKLFESYYPHFLNYIIIFNMPWILNAAFKVVKSLLPAKAIERLKFVNKDTLKSVVAPEQALSVWGGLDEYEFVFVPEGKSQSEHTPKKVTFAEQGDSQHSPGEMLRLNPSDTIIFKSGKDEISGQLVITNMDDNLVSFKIRTTSPEKFRVRPSAGTLGPGGKQTVSIVVLPDFHVNTVTKDRFLVMSVQIPKLDLSPKELAEVWANSTGSKVDEYRLKCQFLEREEVKNGKIFEKLPEKTENISDALTQIRSDYKRLQGQVQTLKIFQLLTMLLSGVGIIFAILIYAHTGKREGYCDDTSM